MTYFASVNDFTIFYLFWKCFIEFVSFCRCSIFCHPKHFSKCDQIWAFRAWAGKCWLLAYFYLIFDVRTLHAIEMRFLDTFEIQPDYANAFWFCPSIKTVWVKLLLFLFYFLFHFIDKITSQLTQKQGANFLGVGCHEQFADKGKWRYVLSIHRNEENLSRFQSGDRYFKSKRYLKMKHQINICPNVLYKVCSNHLPLYLSSQSLN